MFLFFTAFENTIGCILSIAWLQFWWYLHGWWWHIEGNCIFIWTSSCQQLSNAQWKSTVHIFHNHHHHYYCYCYFECYSLGAPERCSISIYFMLPIFFHPFCYSWLIMTGMLANVFGAGLCWTISYWLWSAVPMVVKR